MQRILTRLQQKLGAETACSTVWDCVHRRRQEIVEAAGAAPAAGFVIRHSQPGMGAEGDVGDAWVERAGQGTKYHLFALRLAYSLKAVHRIAASCGRARPEGTFRVDRTELSIGMDQKYGGLVIGSNGVGLSCVASQGGAIHRTRTALLDEPALDKAADDLRQFLELPAQSLTRFVTDGEPRCLWLVVQQFIALAAVSRTQPERKRIPIGCGSRDHGTTGAPSVQPGQAERAGPDRGPDNSKT
ncbi:hypothetical protein ACFU8I_01715 [Streptomyces sp. NPDC057540]|uniref:hypothetical protein n=1 Tax=Streptomyces sp. NPDC057540 TaxID=3346160 RepID=UPI0036B934EC